MKNESTSAQQTDQLRKELDSVKEKLKQHEADQRALQTIFATRTPKANGASIVDLAQAAVLAFDSRTMQLKTEVSPRISCFFFIKVSQLRIFTVFEIAVHP